MARTPKDLAGSMTAPRPRKGMPSPRLGEAEFKRRYVAQFVDPAFDPVREEIGKIAAIAWDAYKNSRKSPTTRRAGPEFADPDYELSVDWLAARDAILAAEARHADGSLPPRILVINGSSRSEHT
jgi:hypothetical protein